MIDYRDKIAYIPGGSSGIGLAIAAGLAAKGAHIVLFARNEERLRQAQADLSTRTVSSAQRIAWRALDVTDPQRVTATMNETIVSFGAPDILIYCVGRSHPHYFADVTYEQFDDVMQVNLYGCYNVIAALAPTMRQRGGHIVNVSSMAGFLGVFGFAAYSAAKFGIIGFSESLRAEFKSDGVTVQVLCPPDVDTPMLAEENKTKPAEPKAISAGAKVMTAAQVADDLLRNLGRPNFVILPGWEGKFTHLVKRLSPQLVELVLDYLARRGRRS